MEQSPNLANQHDSAPSSSSSPSASLTVKLHELLDESDTEEETGNLGFQEEMVEEVMQEFYKEITPFPSSSSAQNPSSSSPHVFINEGKNGSCGASVSDKGSSVMAGIEAVGVASGGFMAPENGLEVVVGVDDSKGERNDELFEFGVGVVVGEENSYKIEEFFDEGVDLGDEWLGFDLTIGVSSLVKN